ncbi:MAG TPA: helix-turn-helix domain-containing protein [Candidatus Dormibacteraeota bacterium]|jgi:AcrR family transcriptional regulator
MRAGHRRADPLTGTTRERLIEAAADVIAEAGYDRAGVQEIARRAGLTNGAIYANFRDKSELLAEAVEVGLVRLIGRMDDARRAGASPAQVIELIGRTLALATPARHRRLVSEALAAARRDPDVGERVRQLLSTLESHVSSVVAEALHDGDIAGDVDPSTLARFGVALAIGYHVTYSAGMPEPDPEAWTRLMTRVLASLRA